jgi:hypothetical protein
LQFEKAMMAKQNKQDKQNSAGFMNFILNRIYEIEHIAYYALTKRQVGSFLVEISGAGEAVSAVMEVRSVSVRFRLPISAHTENTNPNYYLCSLHVFQFTICEPQ